VVADRPESAFPRDPETARAIPGVGLYTAAAILSISFNLPYAVVDGNVARVLARLHRLKPPHDRPGARTRMLAQALLDPAHPGDHNQAMMELGALVCLPANPACTATGTGRGRCPVAEHCGAHAAGMTHIYPAKRSRPAPVEVQARLFLLRDRRGRLLVERDHWRFLPRLWLPVIRPEAIDVPGAAAMPAAIDVPGALPKRFRVRVGSLGEAGRVEHTITNHRIRLRVFTGLVDPGPGPLPREHMLVTDAELAGLGRSSILEKALQAEHAAAAAGQRRPDHRRGGSRTETRR
jgi:A/G-specific adenine glycosylase